MTRIEATPENALVTFRAGNPTAVAVVSPSSDTSEPFELSVDVRELLPDTGLEVLPGDISLADIQVQWVPFGLGSAVSPLTYSEVVRGTGYDGRLTARPIGSRATRLLAHHWAKKPISAGHRSAARQIIWHRDRRPRAITSSSLMSKTTGIQTLMLIGSGFKSSTKRES